MGGSASKNKTETNMTLKATMNLVNDISLDVSQQFSSNTKSKQSSSIKQKNVAYESLGGQNNELNGELTQTNDADVSLEMIINIKAKLGADAKIDQIQDAIQKAAMESMSRQNSQTEADLGTLALQINNNKTNIDFETMQNLKNTIAEVFAQKVADTVDSVQEEDLEQLNEYGLEVKGSGNTYKRQVKQANNAIVDLTQNISKDILAELGSAVGQSQSSDQGAITSSTTDQSGQAKSKGLGSLLNGLVIVIAGVSYMLHSLLKNPEGVTAIGNATTDVMKASNGMPFGGNMSKATNINIMIIIAYVLTITFVILMILTIIYFFKWRALDNPLVGVFKKLIAKIIEKAGNDLEKATKKNKIGFIVCAIISAACLIGNITLTTFIKQGKIELAMGMRGGIYGGRRHRRKH